MLKRGSGKVVFTASLLFFQGGLNVPGYTAPKSGLAGLTKALANEWAPRGVNVNAIAPGYIATDHTQALQDDPDRSRSIPDRIPARRWGRGEDLAGATVFLGAVACLSPGNWEGLPSPPASISTSRPARPGNPLNPLRRHHAFRPPRPRRR